MNIFERFGWSLIAIATGRRARCFRGHIVPQNDCGDSPCTFCMKWCEACGLWVPLGVGLRDVHWPHPKTPRRQRSKF